MSNVTAIDRIQCKGHCGQTAEVPNADGLGPSRCPRCGSGDIASAPIEDDAVVDSMKDAVATVHDFIVGIEPFEPETDYDRGYADACKVALAVLDMILRDALLMTTTDGHQINPLTDDVYTWTGGRDRTPSRGPMRFNQASLRFEPPWDSANPFFARREAVVAYINASIPADTKTQSTP